MVDVFVECREVCMISNKTTCFVGDMQICYLLSYFFYMKFTINQLLIFLVKVVFIYLHDRVAHLLGACFITWSVWVLRFWKKVINASIVVIYKQNILEQTNLRQLYKINSWNFNSVSSSLSKLSYCHVILAFQLPAR